MPINRRQFIKLTAGASLTSTLGVSISSIAADHTPIKAAAIDAFAIFDPRPIFNLVNTLYPEKGERLAQLWYSRQSEYQWIRTLTGQYVDFWQASEEGLIFAANQLNLNMSIAKRELLMNTYLNLRAWPDTLDGLSALKRSGIKTALLSNMTSQMLKTNVENNKLTRYFDHIISTDEAKTYKPAAEAYQLAVDTFARTKQEIAFAAYAGWDVAGAKWFGFPTFWVNRSDFPPEPLGADADAVGKNLNDLIAFITAKPTQEEAELETQVIKPSDD